LVNRTIALEPSLKPAGYNGVMATIGAAFLAAILVLAPVGAGAYFFLSVIQGFQKTLADAMHKQPPVAAQKSPNPEEIPASSPPQ
jgi:hypothetical protein